MRMISGQKILVVLDSHDSTFMENDVEILRKHFIVDVIYRPDYPRIRHLVLDVARRLARHRPRLVYCWFVNPWDTAPIICLARLIGAKSALVTGGYDIAEVPGVEFGMLRLPRARPRTQLALNWADLVIPFSEFSRDQVLCLAQPRSMHVIYPGVDVDTFRPGGGEKQNLAITVGTVGRANKGLETFARCSKIMPKTQFTLIGRTDDSEALRHLKSVGGDNLYFTSKRVTTGELVEWYRQAKVYVQVSLYEGFGVGVAESMACECTPVVTNTTALPEVVGDAGFYAGYGDVEATAAAIEQALTSPCGPAARRRVVENFTLAQREERLLTQLDNLLA